MAGIFQKINRFLSGPEIALFHEFHKPPYGGGNTFLLALEKELKHRGYSVGRNSVGPRTKVILFNSYQFDFKKLEEVKKRHTLKMIHRVDGPIGTYRGEGVEIDKKIWSLNHALADATVFQSEYSFNKHKELGLDFKNPTIITNASDPAIFNRTGRITPPRDERKVHLIATSWSDNPRKGGQTLTWLDEHLDHNRYDLTFVGRTRAVFRGAKIIDPLPSEALAQVLKEHDIYLAPSQDDPCSNALIEALTTGLPAVFRRSGGHPELVDQGGEGFVDEYDVLQAIDKVASDIEGYQREIKVASLADVTDAYVKLFT